MASFDIEEKILVPLLGSLDFSDFFKILLKEL